MPLPKAIQTRCVPLVPGTVGLSLDREAVKPRKYGHMQKNVCDRELLFTIMRPMQAQPCRTDCLPLTPQFMLRKAVIDMELRFSRIGWAKIAMR